MWCCGSECTKITQPNEWMTRQFFRYSYILPYRLFAIELDCINDVKVYVYVKYRFIILTHTYIWTVTKCYTTNCGIQFSFDACWQLLCGTVCLPYYFVFLFVVGGANRLLNSNEISWSFVYEAKPNHVQNLQHLNDIRRNQNKMSGFILRPIYGFGKWFNELERLWCMPKRISSEWHEWNEWMCTVWK